MTIHIEDFKKFDQAELEQLTDSEVSMLEGITHEARTGRLAPQHAALFRKHVDAIKAALVAADEALP